MPTTTSRSTRLAITRETTPARRPWYERAAFGTADEFGAGSLDGFMGLRPHLRLARIPPQQDLVDDLAHPLVRLDALHPQADHTLGGNRAGGVADEVWQVHVVDDLAGDRRDVYAVDDGLEVNSRHDPLDHLRYEGLRLRRGALTQRLPLPRDGTKPCLWLERGGHQRRPEHQNGNRTGHVQQRAGST